MRVTKTIREFIVEQIRIKAEQSEHVAELLNKAEEEKKSFHNELNRLYDDYDKSARELLNKYGIEASSYRFSTSLDHFEHSLSSVKKYKKARQEVLEDRRKAELDIIAEMELGGSKEELMRKLEELKFQ